MEDEKREFMRMLIQETMKQMPVPIPEKERGKCEEVMLKVFDEGITPKEAMGFSDEMIEHMYAYGYRLYNLGSYKNAKKVFSSLMIFLPEEARFALGKAASCHRLKEYKEAADNYYLTGLLDVDSPMPFFYMYDCLIQMNRPGKAAQCLKEVIRRCGKHAIFSKVKERCLLLLKNLEKTEKQNVAKKGASL
jgi:type III secretion system low calcium response chaperone LcrH/SycD